MIPAERLAERFWSALEASSAPGANFRSWTQLDFRSRQRIIAAMKEATNDPR